MMPILHNLQILDTFLDLSSDLDYWRIKLLLRFPVPVWNASCHIIKLDVSSVFVQHIPVLVFRHHPFGDENRRCVFVILCDELVPIVYHCLLRFRGGILRWFVTRVYAQAIRRPTHFLVLGCWRFRVLGGVVLYRVCSFVNRVAVLDIFVLSWGRILSLLVSPIFPHNYPRTLVLTHFRQLLRLLSNILLSVRGSCSFVIRLLLNAFGHLAERLRVYDTVFRVFIFPRLHIQRKLLLRLQRLWPFYLFSRFIPWLW